MKSPKKKSAPAASKKRKKMCSASACRAEAVSDGYCRLHYLKHWKHIKLNAQVKAEQRLNRFVNRLSKKYPKDFLEKIREGLESEDKFNETVRELDLDHDTAMEKETEGEFLERFS